LRCCQKIKVLAEQNKGGNVPAHDKNTNGHSNDGKTYGAYVSQIFRSEKQSIGAIAFHKAAVCHCKHQKPEDQQYLVLAEMQEDELNG
jgi:hypothetical protein